MTKYYIAGHHGMVGNAIFRLLNTQSKIDIITRTHSELDLTKQEPVKNFMHKQRPDVVILSAAKVGGIQANNLYPGQFIYENLMIECNVIHQAFKAGVKKLLFLGSSCIYPKETLQPIQENTLLTGKLEPTNEPYALAKIAGIKLCESYNRQYGVDYRSIMPTNLYGPGDNFHSVNSHVVPSLINRFHEAAINNVNEVIIWGTGKPCREFLHVDDLAEAAIFILNLPKDAYLANTKPMLSHINVGAGKDISILGLAKMIANITGFKGKIIHDLSKPDGTMKKLLDISLLNELGWAPKISLQKGLKDTYHWFIKNIKKEKV